MTSTLTTTAAESFHDTSRRLRAVVLLAGRVGRNPFAEGVGRSVLDLPVTARTTLLDAWIERLDELAVARGLPRLLLRVATDRDGPPPASRPRRAGSRVDVEIVVDPADYRGTAGVVKDLTRSYDDDDRVLVAAANQIQREPLADVLAAFGAEEEGVAIVPHQGGDSAGLFLLRRGRLDAVPDVGFVDLKEQALPAAGAGPPLVVARRAKGASLPVRTLEEYVQALRAVHGGGLVEDAYAEVWRPAFRVVEPGARVEPGAVLHDSVVLRGGRIESGGAAAASVVCDGGVVRRGESVFGSIIAGGNLRRDR